MALGERISILKFGQSLFSPSMSEKPVLPFPEKQRSLASSASGQEKAPVGESLIAAGLAPNLVELMLHQSAAQQQALQQYLLLSGALSNPMVANQLLAQQLASVGMLSPQVVQQMQGMNAMAAAGFPRPSFAPSPFANPLLFNSMAQFQQFPAANPPNTRGSGQASPSSFSFAHGSPLDQALLPSKDDSVRSEMRRKRAKKTGKAGEPLKRTSGQHQSEAPSTKVQKTQTLGAHFLVLEIFPLVTYQLFLVLYRESCVGSLLGPLSLLFVSFAPSFLFLTSAQTSSCALTQAMMSCRS